MTGLLFFLLLVAGGAIYAVGRRVRALEAQLNELEVRLDRAERRARLGEVPLAAAPPRPAQAPAPATEVPATEVPIAEATPAPRPTPAIPEAPPEPARLSLETLVGGRLPIWIGGAALVLAGFFLVRYSIESGLLGPAARTLLAALFAAALVAGSELARRLPGLSDDPRVAQALAGAGTASAYATLYMAAALYHLIGAGPAFVMMVLLTAGALGLALRHGPPTAVMALIGGFVAPLVAGFDAAGVGPLLVYLALFIAALFGLAVHRRWAWLALAASAAGFGWINFLLATHKAPEMAGVGAFAVLLAAGASAALPATGTRNPWLRLAPLVAGFVQLIALAPALQFDGLAWSFYLVLAAAALVLAWREKAFVPGAVAALVLMLLLEMLALVQPDAGATPLAAIAATLIFAIPGHLLARRGTGWAAVALGGTAGPLLVAHACAASLLPASGWAALELVAAAAAFSLAWRTRTGADPQSLVGATATAALLAAVGLSQFVAFAWIALPLAVVAAALAGWARFQRMPALFELPFWPLLAAAIAAADPLFRFSELIALSLTGDTLTYPMLPPLADTLRQIALPAVAAAALLADRRQFARLRPTAAAGTLVLALLAVYALAKQPLAIATHPAFRASGFIERALITQALLAGGWALLRFGAWRTTGRVLLAIGLFRFAWFDLLILDPALVAQQVGGVPLLNAAVFHAALAAFWLWTLPAEPRLRTPAMLVTVVALAAAVRQAAHGSLLTGPITTAENGGYSLVLLGAALFWLWRGIRTGARDLRIAGLALLTLVTFKVFLVDAAALDGVLRILSFLGLGLALIGIGWAYNRFLGRSAAAPASHLSP